MDTTATSTPADRRRCREQRTAELRARALDLRRGGATYARVATEIGLSFKAAYKLTRLAERLAESPHWTQRLSARAVLLLQNLQIDTRTLSESDAARELARRTLAELKQHRNSGRVTIAELVAWLASHGLKLAIEISAEYARAPPPLK